MLPRTALPSYCHHKASGQAIVRLCGRDIYLGPHGTRLSRDNYDRVVSEWLAAGRRLPAIDASHDLSIAELVNAFRKSDEIVDSQQQHYHQVMALLVRLYGRTPAAEFGPLALRAIRENLVAANWKRKTI